MALKNVDDRAATPAESALSLQMADTPEPLLYHPVMGVSLAMIVAVAAQIAVWLFNARLLGPNQPAPAPLPSAAIAHPALFEALRALLFRVQPATVPSEQTVFASCLLLCLLSVAAWYAAARFTLGPAWALWTAMLWSVHPVFAFLAQRPTPLTLVMVLVPFTWCLLLSWSVSPRPWKALAGGAMMGLAALAGPANVLVFVLMMPLLVIAARGWARRWRGPVLMTIGFVLPVAGGLLAAHNSTRLSPAAAMQKDLWAALDTADGTPMAMAARNHLAGQGRTEPGNPLEFLARQARTSPRSTLAWLARRAWRTLYTTSDHRFERPLLALQLVWLIPALWGTFVALRHRPWRWRTAAAICLLAVTWLASAIIEPKCRSLAPAGGVVIMLALVGVADLYERAFGRRLTEPDEA